MTTSRPTATRAVSPAEELPQLDRLQRSRQRAEARGSVGRRSRGVSAARVRLLQGGEIGLAPAALETGRIGARREDTDASKQAGGLDARVDPRHAEAPHRLIDPLPRGARVEAREHDVGAQPAEGHVLDRSDDRNKRRAMG